MRSMMQAKHFFFVSYGNKLLLVDTALGPLV